MIDIEIDGKKYQAEPGSLIIEVADNHQVHIPRFCYHKKLSIAANCRMCLVEVEKSGKPLPACATPVTAGMRVFTKSPKALEAQRYVMEFLLINHPLDCPICDQGGECELQDVSMGYGKDISLFSEGKRSIKDKDIGPLIQTDMTRCIQCTRCVRFGQEIAGLRELGATGRGEKMEIGTYIEHSLQSELSGNVIDICPVGALTSKPFRFKARAWEMQQKASIAPHDCVGSHIYLHTLRQQVLRVVPQENEAINETWISDRDRFGYLGLTHDERLSSPLIKRNGQWEETDWTTALRFAVERLHEVNCQYGADQLGGVISPNATLEELYLFQKVLRSMGSHNIDHRLHQSDFADQQSAPLHPGLNFAFEELENFDAFLLVGSNIHREQPIAGHRIRKATLQGAQVVSINPVDFEYHFPVKDKKIVHPARWVTELESFLKTQPFKNAQRPVVLFGALALNHPQSSALQYLGRTFAQSIGAQFGVLTEGANSAGAWLAGAIPHRQAMGSEDETPGLTLHQMWEKALKGYILFDVEPQLDCANPSAATRALQQAYFVMSLSPFKSDFFLKHAHVILPTAPFAENSGTLVNAEGKWQSFEPAIHPQGEARPGWKILRVLGNLMHLNGFDYVSTQSINEELKALSLVSSLSKSDVKPEVKPINQATLMRITEWPIYRCDNLVRHSDALQNSATSEAPAIHIHSKTAEKYKLNHSEMIWAIQQGGKAYLPVVLDERVPEDCVLIPTGFEETAMLGEPFGSIELKKTS